MNVKPSARLRWFDLPLGVLLGFAWTLLCCDWFAHFHTDANGIFYADLIEYCNGVSTKNLLGIGASNKRSAFAMLLPRHFANTRSSMAGSGCVWGQVELALLYWWARSLMEGEWALCPPSRCVAAMTFISRVLSSYPAIVCVLLPVLQQPCGVLKPSYPPHVHRGHRCQHDLLPNRGIV